MGRDIKLAHATREIGRTSGQRIHLDGYSRSRDFLLHLDISRTAVEECLKGIDIPILHDNSTIERDCRNIEFSSHLRKHHVLAPSDSAIRSAVVCLDLETLLLRQLHFLCVESLEVGHLAVESCQLHERIYLIGEQNRLLFVHSLLVGAHLDEEVGTRYFASRSAHLRFVVISSASVLTLLSPAYCDFQGVRLDSLSVASYLSRRNGKRSIFVGADDIRESDGRRRSSMSVDHLKT